MLNNFLPETVLDSEKNDQIINTGRNSDANLYISIIIYAVVIVVVLALAFYINRYLNKRIRPGQGINKRLRIVDRVYVGKDQQIAVLLAGEKAYLIGITQGGITNLDELDMDMFKEPLADGDKKETSFGSILAANLGIKRKPPKNPTSPDTSEDPAKSGRDSNNEEN